MPANRACGRRFAIAQDKSGAHAEKECGQLVGKPEIEERAPQPSLFRAVAWQVARDRDEEYLCGNCGGHGHSCAAPRGSQARYEKWHRKIKHGFYAYGPTTRNDTRHRCGPPSVNKEDCGNHFVRT